jgi:hypothetical protein
LSLWEKFEFPCMLSPRLDADTRVDPQKKFRSFQASVCRREKGKEREK